MFTSGLDSAEVYIRVSDTATEPYNVSNTWQMKSADGSTWIDADGLEVGCMCDGMSSFTRGIFSLKSNNVIYIIRIGMFFIRFCDRM